MASRRACAGAPPRAPDDHLNGAKGGGSGSFTDSFVVHMLRDFFILLLVVMAAEVGLKFALQVYDFTTADRRTTERAAEQLADDIRSIMLNSGGPVAARTVYPVLQRNYAKRDLAIAIEPTQTTVDSIKKTFDFTPRGIPAAWPDGRHHESRVTLRAEESCLNCHVDANLGDPLGTVYVRSYLASEIAAWWGDVQISGVLGLGKTIVHTIVLLFLLKARMEPLLSVKAAIANLSKAGCDVSIRAPVRSRDEFGELARDLNLFLDRLSHILEDLDSVLHKLRAVNTRLTTTQEHMTARYDAMRAHTGQAAASAITAAETSPPVDARWLRATEAALTAMADAINARLADSELDARLRALSADTRDAATRLEATEGSEVARSRIGTDLQRMSGELDDFGHHMREMAVMEEQMQAIAAAAQTLLNRLAPTQSSEHA